MRSIESKTLFFHLSYKNYSEKKEIIINKIIVTVFVILLLLSFDKNLRIFALKGLSGDRHFLTYPLKANHTEYEKRGNISKMCKIYGFIDRERVK